MRPLDESKLRWDETIKQSSSFTDLQRAVKFNGPDNPCVAGCRSVCWKAFLLFNNVGTKLWLRTLLETRNIYSALREHYLKYIKHPELLNELSLDPLADDLDSPWTTVRKDEAVRTEIQQDVQRLPDEPFYQQQSTQTLILDILFIWVKLNPDLGGYRQGMHELLATLLFVLDQDAIDRRMVGDVMADPNMLEMFDSYFLEHDAFTLFSKLMEHAKPFYDVSVGAGHLLSEEQSAIVEKSKMIHEVALMRIDPELAKHFQNIEVLPQIFLIRWIRLLYGREFPFGELLILWDAIFAFDPTLELIDLICVAMLLRIRWSLLEADYSVALQLLLNYPRPEPPHGPHTFVDDAVYLKDHYSATGGASIIMKYTGKMPSPISDQRPSTPQSNFPGLSIGTPSRGTRSPITPPARFIQQRGGVEALFQGAAKNVIERGEKLGFNQAVRDALGEIRKNMQDLQEATGKAMGHSRSNSNTPRSNGFASGPLAVQEGDDSRASAEVGRRNKQLALLLDEAVTVLQELVAAKLQGDKEKTLEALEIAAAKAHFVKICLQEPFLDLPTDLVPDTEPVPPPQVVVDDAAPVVAEIQQKAASSINKETSPSLMIAENEAMLDLKTGRQPKPVVLGRPDTPSSMEGVEHHHSTPQSTSRQPRSPAPICPVPIPTSSTTAQLSFAQMLEPGQDQSPSAAPGLSSLTSSAAPTIGKRRRDSASRERNAFLFGEVTTNGDMLGVQLESAKAFTSDDIFGLEPLKRSTKARASYEGLFGAALPDD